MRAALDAALPKKSFLSSSTRSLSTCGTKCPTTPLSRARTACRARALCPSHSPPRPLPPLPSLFQSGPDWHPTPDMIWNWLFAFPFCIPYVEIIMHYHQWPARALQQTIIHLSTFHRPETLGTVPESSRRAPSVEIGFKSTRRTLELFLDESLGRGLPHTIPFSSHRFCLQFVFFPIINTKNMWASRSKEPIMRNAD